LHWVVENKAGLSIHDNYLDDFIFPGAALTNDCQKVMDTFSLKQFQKGHRKWNIPWASTYLYSTCHQALYLTGQNLPG
jgi:hypothetical protein